MAASPPAPNGDRQVAFDTKHLALLNLRVKSVGRDDALTTAAVGHGDAELLAVAFAVDPKLDVVLDAVLLDRQGAVFVPL